MTDYIKREDALFIALQQPFFQNSLAAEIKMLDGIDIVRCKDCRRRFSCVTFEGIGDMDGFCSMGERRE